ncbi:hypothetical protein PGT21_016183 [Puccinia graminis f. sp. tritici]|uniref:Secreted protein n=1 Tax=Puccinia graminis f. sp. tritici TaxID=56615 RepID=A0A5B0PW95_PUCGR|nr:hypothetical protein PGT21_016183 [Puccinia graminis f. sp. tritici]KAA1105224.1 hypothetical protein PGTUg99_015428 [Puccinia graminis f. sp. tritici]
MRSFVLDLILQPSLGPCSALLTIVCTCTLKSAHRSGPNHYERSTSTDINIFAHNCWTSWSPVEARVNDCSMGMQQQSIPEIRA